MRALLQRVAEASVTVDGKITGQIDGGLLVFVCAMPEDTEDTARTLAAKIAKFRIFSDEAGKMNRSIADAGGKLLLVSQFTLAADTSRGNRPGFSGAAKPAHAKALYEATGAALSALGLHVEYGEFGADMSVALENDGPATFWLEL